MAAELRRLRTYFVGAAIDRGHGRAVMTGGALAAGLGFVAWSFVQTPVALYAVWALLGATMAFTLYEPAFAVLTKRYPTRYLKGITALTLIGGFASTLSFPVCAALNASVGWRQGTLVIGAGFYKHTSRLDLAEPLFREMLAVLERSSPPGDLNLAINRVGVGGGLSMLGKFADAEPMLVEGFRTLRASPHTPRSPDDYLVGACERIIKHYEAWDAAERAAGRAGKAAELAQWRAELAALPPPTAK